MFRWLDCMPILHTRDVAPKQACALCNIPYERFFSSRTARKRSPIIILIYPLAPILLQRTTATLDCLRSRPPQWKDAIDSLLYAIWRVARGQRENGGKLA